METLKKNQYEVAIKKIEQQLEIFNQKTFEKLNEQDFNLKQQLIIDQAQELKEINKILESLDYSKVDFDSWYYIYKRQFKENEKYLWLKLISNEKLNKYEAFYLYRLSGYDLETKYSCGFDIRDKIKKKIQELRSDILGPSLIDKNKQDKDQFNYDTRQLKREIENEAYFCYPLNKSTISKHLDKRTFDKLYAYIDKKIVEHQGYNKMDKVYEIKDMIKDYQVRIESVKWNWNYYDRSKIIWNQQ